MTKLSKSVGGSRAIVVVQHGVRAFRVYLPKNGTPKNVAAVIATIAPRVRSIVAAGEVMCDFISAIDASTRLQLIANGREYNFTGKADMTYVLSLNGSMGLRIAVHGGGNISAKAMFEGNIYQFADWASKLNGLESAVLKTVQFVYSGGSKPGATRTIRVDKVGNDGGVAWLEGRDLSDPDLAYKRYNCDRITSEITCVN